MDQMYRLLTGSSLVLPVADSLLPRPISLAFNLELGGDGSDDHGFELLSVGCGVAVLEVSCIPSASVPELSQFFRRHEVPKALFLAALACAIRPTNAVIWTYMFAWLLWTVRRQSRNILYVVANAIAIGCVPCRRSNTW